MAEARNDLIDALAWLDWLEARPGNTSERWALRGSLFKRWAVCESGERRWELLEKSRNAYIAGGEKTYTLQNVMALNFVLKKGLEDLPQRVTMFVEAARQNSLARNRDFWSIVGYPDALLHKHVMDGTLGVPDVLEDIKQGYADARRSGASPLEWASVCDQIWFLAAMTRDESLPCYDLATAVALDGVLASLLA